MPESSVRKEAVAKKKLKQHDALVETRREHARAKAVSPTSRRWVPPTFITLGLLGVLWLVVYYVAGQYIPPMAKLGDWNIGIGMALMASAFAVATLWK